MPISPAPHAFFMRASHDLEMKRKKTKNSLEQAAVFLPVLAGALAFLGSVAYCAANGSGHSGFDLRDAWMLYVPVLVAAVGVWHLGGRVEAVLAASLGVLGGGFGFFVHHFGVMQEYQFWISQGMQVRNPRADWLLSGYVGFSLVVSVGAIWISRMRGAVPSRG